MYLSAGKNALVYLKELLFLICAMSMFLYLPNLFLLTAGLNQNIIIRSAMFWKILDIVLASNPALPGNRLAAGEKPKFNWDCQNVPPNRMSNQVAQVMLEGSKQTACQPVSAMLRSALLKM